MFVKKLKFAVILFLILCVSGYGGGKLVLATRAAQQSVPGAALAQAKTDDARAEKKTRDAESETQLYTHRCIYVAAEDAATTLGNFLEIPLSFPSKRTGRPGPMEAIPRSQVITWDVRTNEVSVHGTPEKIAKAKKVMAKLDVGTEPYYPRRRNIPETLDEVATELKIFREKLKRSEEDWKTKMREAAKPPDVAPGRARSGQDDIRVLVAEYRIYVEMLEVLQLRLQELEKARTSNVPAQVEEAMNLVLRARRQLMSFEGFEATFPR